MELDLIWAPISMKSKTSPVILGASSFNRCPFKQSWLTKFKQRPESCLKLSHLLMLDVTLAPPTSQKKTHTGPARLTTSDTMTHHSQPFFFLTDAHLSHIADGGYSS